MLAIVIDARPASIGNRFDVRRILPYRLRLIAGEAFGLTNVVTTHSQLFYVHAVLQAGTRFGLPTGNAEQGTYVARGSVEGN